MCSGRRLLLQVERAQWLKAEESCEMTPAEFLSQPFHRLTNGCCLAEADMNNRPFVVLTEFHNDARYDRDDANGNWAGMLSEENAAGVDMCRTGHVARAAGGRM